tara:strand:- start:849 stop:1022 length:174 start_codon:yes stop_codon:yes gene_type:complete
MHRAVFDPFFQNFFWNIENNIGNIEPEILLKKGVKNSPVHNQSDKLKWKMVIMVSLL